MYTCMRVYYVSFTSRFQMNENLIFGIRCQRQSRQCDRIFGGLALIKDPGGQSEFYIMCQAEYRTLQWDRLPTPATLDRFRRNPPSPSLVRLRYGASLPLVIAEIYDVH